jgi:hypothetical protein
MEMKVEMKERKKWGGRPPYRPLDRWGRYAAATKTYPL